jgi:hypothetical protein
MQADENVALRRFKAIRRTIVLINLAAAIAAAALILIFLT